MYLNPNSDEAKKAYVISLCYTEKDFSDDIKKKLLSFDQIFFDAIKRMQIT